MRSLLAAGLALLSLTAFVNADEWPVAIGEPVVYLVLFDSNNAELTNTESAVLDEVSRVPAAKADCEGAGHDVCHRPL